MKTTTLLGLLALAAACASTRSISDPYENERNSFYRGELTEWQVLGIDGATGPTEAEIRLASGAPPIRLAAGSSILLIQSGAPIPDDDLVRAVEGHFRVIPMSGVPEEEHDSYSNRIRLAAIRAGCGAVVCCWGLLEAERRDLVTKKISWVPLVGSFVPDETQDMRIRLKVLVMEPRTGRWFAYAPIPDEDSSISMRLNRGSSDAGQVERLKKQAYDRAAAELERRLSR